MQSMSGELWRILDQWIKHQCRDSTIAMIQARSIEKQKHSIDVRKFKRRIVARWKDSRVIVYQYGSLKAACRKKVYNARTITVASIIFTSSQYPCLLVLKIIYVFTWNFFQLPSRYHCKLFRSTCLKLRFAAIVIFCFVNKSVYKWTMRRLRRRWRNYVAKLSIFMLFSFNTRLTYPNNFFTLFYMFDYILIDAFFWINFFLNYVLNYVRFDKSIIFV